MTEASSIYVRLEGQDVSLSTLLTKVDAETQKTADSAARLQAQYARLASSQGNTSQATAILTNALQNNGGASERTVVSLSQQLATVERGATVYQQFGQAAASSLTNIVGPAALATASIGAVIAVGKSFDDAFQFKATLDANASSLKSALEGYRDVSSTLQEATAFGRQYNITQEQTNSILTSSIDVLKQSSGSVTQLETALLRLQTRDVSKPISEAARAMRELQAGDVTSIKELFNVPAKDALAMKNAIAAGGDSVQVLTAWLDKAGVGMDALALRSQGAAGKMHELAVAQEDLVLAQAQFAQGPGLVLLQAQIQTTTGATRVLTGDFESARQSIANAAEAGSFGFRIFDTILGGNLTKIAAYQTAANDSAAAAQQNAAATDAWNAALATHSAQTTAETDIEQQRINILAATAALTAASTAAELVYATSLEQTGIQARAAAAAADAKANSDQLASVNAQTHAVSQSALAQQAQLAAGALLNAGPAGARTAALLAGSSSQVDILTAAYYRLAAAQGAAGQAATQAKLDKQTPRQLIGADSDQASVRAEQRAAVQETRAERIKAASDAATAERGYQQTLGNTGPALAHARNELAQLTVGTAAYINKQNEIAQLQKKAAGGGGGAKLSDQQKLNNQLLTDQEGADNKYEDAEAAHQERLLKIAIDFAKKTLEQQKLNEVSKRQSQADFYDRLTSSELNKKKGGTDALKAIDAEYQAAYQKSQELAQAGNAKLAADYLALKSKQTADELTYQENVAKAKEAKDSAEVGRLAQIHKLRQDAAAEEEKQLLAGGDANVTAKDQALQEESDKYASAQDKIGLASDRATERQIANAQRAGKAIDTTTLAIERQRQSYDGVGVAPGQTGGAAPVATTVGTPDQGAQASAAADPIASAIASLRDAISAVETATREAGRGVESAVKSLPRSVS